MCIMSMCIQICISINLTVLDFSPFENRFKNKGLFNVFICAEASILAKSILISLSFN